jgi:predicted permease
MLAPFGRLRPGATIAAAHAELNRINEVTRGPVGAPRRGTAVRVSGLLYGMLELLRPAILTLVIAASLVLLITVANLANLFLSRGTSRAMELGVRTALGASRWRLARMILVESALVALGGAFVAVVAAASLYRILYDVVPPHFRVFMPTSLDARALSLVVLTTMVVTGILALVTTWQAMRAEVRHALRPQARSVRGGALTVRFGRGLLTVQAALSLAVVVASALVVGSFARLSRADMGYDVGNLTESSLLPFLAGDSAASRATKYLRLEELILQIPGVEVGMIDATPWSETVMKALSSDRNMRGGLYSVSHGFLHAIGARLVDGRWPTASEWTLGRGIAVVNRSAASRLWPGESAIGKVHQPPQAGAAVVIGVIDDLRPRRGKPADPAMYVPYDFSFPVAPQFVLRSSLPPDQLTQLLTEAVRGVNAGAQVSPPVPVANSLESDLRMPRLLAGIFTIFAVAVLLVGTVGIVGLLLYLVQQRRYEIGVRMALGADARAIQRLIYGRVLVPVTLGMTLGLLGAWWGVRFIESLLFEMRGHDPRVFAAAAFTLGLVTVIAAFGPARSAARTDPAIVLRTQ